MSSPLHHISRGSLRKNLFPDQKPRAGSLLRSCALAGIGLALLSAVLTVGGSEKPAKTARIANVAPKRAASRIYIDPKTGELKSAPPSLAAQALPPELETALSASTAGLQIEIGAGGGKMVRLQGRFRHLNTVTVPGDSLAGVRCVDPGSKSTPQEQESRK